MRAFETKTLLLLVVLVIMTFFFLGTSTSTPTSSILQNHVHRLDEQSQPGWKEFLRQWREETLTASSSSSSSWSSSSSSSSRGRRQASSGYDPADANCTIVIAHSATLSGLAVSVAFAENVIHGELLWLDWANQVYGPILVDGNLCNFSLQVYDDQRNSTVVRSVYRALVNDSSVNFLLAPPTTPTSLQAVSVTEPAGRMLIGTTVASDEFYKGKPNSFLTLTPYSTFVDSALKVFSIKGAKTVAWIAETPTATESAFSSMCGPVESKLADLGMTLIPGGTWFVPDRFAYNTEAGLANISATAQLIKQADPDVLLGCVNIPIWYQMLYDLKDIHYIPRGVYSLLDEGLPPEISLYTTGGTQWSSLAAYAADPYFGTPRDYNRTFSARWGEEPDYFSAAGTAAALLLHLAIERAGTLTESAVKAAYATTNIDIFWGRVSFDAEGAPSLRDIIVIQFSRTNELEVIGPFRSATAEVIYPAPSWDDRVYDPEYFDHTSEIVLAALSGACILSSLALMVFVLVFWSNVVITAASPLFLLLFLSGSIILYASIFMWMLHTNDAMCILTFWFLAVGFGLMFGALFAKTWRIKKILYPSNEGSVFTTVWKFLNSLFCLKGEEAKKATRAAKKQFKQVKVVTWKRLLIVLAVIVGIEVIICSIFTIIAPFFDLAEKVTESEEYQGENYTECEETAVSITFIVILVVYNFCLLLYGVFLSWVLRNVQWALFNESKSIAFAMYNLFFFGALIGGLQVSDSVERESMFIVRSALILCAVFVAVATLFIPKIWYISKGVNSLDGSASKHTTMSIEMEGKEETQMTALDQLIAESEGDGKAKYRIALKSMLEIINAGGLTNQLEGLNSKLQHSESEGSADSSESSDSSESDVDGEEGIP